MNFSQQVKNEIAHQPISSKIEGVLELSAIARTNASVIFNKKGTQLCFFSENPDVIDRIQALIVFLYGERPEIRRLQDGHLNKKPTYRLFVSGEAMEDFLSQSGFNLIGGYQEDRGRILGRLSSLPNSMAYLRGSFLAAGSVVEPKKSYHLEMVVDSQEDKELLAHVIASLQYPFKSMQRRGMTVFYLKDSDDIADFLVDLGASNAMLKLADARAYKDLRNHVNRQVNAETANLEKQVEASLRQQAAISSIEAAVGLDTLPDGLRELAVLRKKNPGKSLKELGKMANPPLSKSGVNHRMNKIIDLAAELSHEKEGAGQNLKGE